MSLVSGVVRIATLVVGATLSGVSLADEALPPEIVADRYFLQLEESISNGDHATGLKLAQRLIELRKEHSITLPETFHYKHAEVALLAGSLEVAEYSITKHLNAIGKDGVFYVHSLRMLDRIDQIRGRLADGPKCGKRRYDCWMTLANQSECYIWSDFHRLDVTVVWSGACSGGFANGNGTISLKVDDKVIESQSGLVQDGKRQNDWIERAANGVVSEGSYVDGQRHGEWLITEPDDGSDNGGRIERVTFAEGQRHGLTRISWPSGQSLDLPYVDGLISGLSIRRFSDGSKVVGRWLSSEKEGVWKHSNRDGSVIREETFSKGQLNGPWRHAYPSGCTERGAYKEGKKEGDWEECTGSLVERGAYANGDRNGVWEITDRRDYSFTKRGPYVAGKKHGIWYTKGKIHPNTRDILPCGGYTKEPFVDGEKHGEQIMETKNCTCKIMTYNSGNRVAERGVGRRTCRREFY